MHFVFYPIEFVPNIRTFHAGYINIPVIRTYIPTTKSFLITGIHSIFYAGYKNIICSSRRCSYNGIHCINGYSLDAQFNLIPLHISVSEFFIPDSLIRVPFSTMVSILTYRSNSHMWV